MIQIQQTEAYAKWFSGLRDRVARARIDIRIRRLSLGNTCWGWRLGAEGRSRARLPGLFHPAGRSCNRLAGRR